MESIRKLQEKEKTVCQSIHLLPGNPIFVQSKVADQIGRFASATFLFFFVRPNILFQK